MNEKHNTSISGELNISRNSVEATARLLEDGATIPFIARYRKEATGSLDETVITAIRDRLGQLDLLDKRRAAILKSIEDQDKLTDELSSKVLEADTLAVLEDIYLPYRPKRRTRATIAREKGLEPLAQVIFDQNPDIDPLLEGARFINSEKGIASVEEALAGALDIVAEWVNENAEARAKLRTLFTEKGVLRSKVLAGKEEDGIQYRDYYQWEESAKTAPSHRILATRRGEKEGFLAVHIAPPEEDAVVILETLFLKGVSECSALVGIALQDSYKRLLAPSLETETKQMVKERADEEAIRIFANNLRHLLMAPPLGSKRILAVDPGFRTGCKVVCLDPQGKLIHNETIYPHTGEQAAAKAAERLATLAGTFSIEAFAIGNGTAGRETEAFVRSLNLAKNIQIIMVDESGASIYSASETAREEFPDHDLTVRGSVSIGRRLIDPLAELVKLDPKSIGVGQYQHDVDQGELKQSLDDVVMSCVNAVGVEVNTASSQLLAYVSGLGPQLAGNIVGYRNENGPFRSRAELRKVPRLGPKAFQQAAGFLRIRDGKNPLDSSAVHPESYSIVERMAGDSRGTVTDIMRDPALRKKIDLSRYTTAEVGLPTLTDILEELSKPGRDPRKSFEQFSFTPGIESVNDLESGMKLPGIVTNVTAFGAFVDIGVHRDGLVHLSELSDRFVKNPAEVVRVHQHVTVTVMEVDKARNRISLSMKGSPHSNAELLKPGSAPPPKKKHDAVPKPRSGGKGAFNNPFEALLKKP
ncbi:MAG: Tex family protein [Syntrophobacteraceae bacterium]